VRTVDVMPTVLELVGLDPDDVALMDGASLVPLLAGDAPDPRYTAYADSINMLTYTVTPRIQDRKHDMLFAVADGEWKYIHHFLREAESELYHVTEDPRELNNLFGAHPDQVQRLLADLQSRPFAPAPDHGQGRMSPADIERLKSLGYNK
jgi:arylsulfatase A-like enzyme